MDSIIRHSSHHFPFTAPDFPQEKMIRSCAKKFNKKTAEVSKAFQSMQTSGLRRSSTAMS